jgi:hypothetical protein
MQFPVSDAATQLFTAEFYGAIAERRPVDSAVTIARKALLDGPTAEWAASALMTSATDAVIFQSA